jgi:2-succinyl-6-hydroxy-2,4-cyclohexadiene-1-carboxylate synthase
VSSLVCIHGFTGAPQSFDRLVRALSKRAALRVCRPTLLGHGATASGRAAGGDAGAVGAERAPRRFEEEVDRIAADIGRRGFAGAHLLGYSLGARVALGLLARHGYLFSSATLIGVHPGLGSREERAARVGSDERWCTLLERRGLGAFLAAWEAQPIFSSQRELDAAELAAQRRVRSSHSAAGLARALRVLGLGQMPDYRGALAACPFEVRLVVGERDEKFSRIACALVRLGVRIDLELVPGVGHNVLLEAGDHVEDVVARALAS